MKSKCFLRIFAGLGNQQFQYAFAFALAAEKEISLEVDTSYYQFPFHPTKQQGFYCPYGLDAFNIHARKVGKLKSFLMGIFFYRKIFFRIFHPILQKFLNLKFITEDNYRYFGELEFENFNIVMNGYFQRSDLIFKYRSEIVEEFTLSSDLCSKGVHLKQLITQSENSVAIHIRRGDYYSKKELREKFGHLGVDYINSALFELNQRVADENLKYFVFSDAVDFVKEHYDLPNGAIYVDDTIQDYHAQHLISLCNHKIITNSTFSWWGAFLDLRRDGVTIAPKHWFSPFSKLEPIICPEEWILI